MGCHVSIGGADFIVPKEAVTEGEMFFYNYLKFPKPLTELGHFELKNLAFLGGMGSGKSSQITDIMYELSRAFEGQTNYFMTDSIDMAVAHADLRPFQLICLDDASTYNDSRMSGGKSRATTTQNFFTYRHESKKQVEALKAKTLEEIDAEIQQMKTDLKNQFTDKITELQEKEQTLKRKKVGGCALIIWAFQHYTSIDVRYREFFDAIFIKKYSRDSNVKKLLNNNKEILDALKKITKLNMFNNYDVRNTAVGSTVTEDLLLLKTNFIPEGSFEIPYYSGASLRDTYIEKLYNHLLSQPLELLAAKKDIIYGYFSVNYEKDPDFLKFHIGDSEISEIIKKVSYVKRKEIEFYHDYHVEPDHLHLQDVVRSPKRVTLKMALENRQLKMELISKLRAIDVKWAKMAKIMDSKSGTLNSQFAEWEKQSKKEQRLQEKFEISDFDLMFQNTTGWRMVFKLMAIRNWTLQDIVDKTGLSMKWVDYQYRAYKSALKFADDEE
jgi:hypothetical protein